MRSRAPFPASAAAAPAVAALVQGRWAWVALLAVVQAGCATGADVVETGATAGGSGGADAAAGGGGPTGGAAGTPSGGTGGTGGAPDASAGAAGRAGAGGGAGAGGASGGGAAGASGAGGSGAGGSGAGGSGAGSGGTAGSGGGDPCAGVSCTTSPSPACVDGTTLRTWTVPGSCSGGACIFSALDTTCALGCAGGQCSGDPCAGVTCTSSPAATCQGGGTLRTFAATGQCVGGTCTYSPQDVACPFGCASGACVADPCQGVTCTSPPGAYCLDATTRRAFGGGACSGGTCTYSSSDTTCPYGCASGVCTGDPCAGISCTSPPAATCLDAVNRRTFVSPGTCAGGSCTYTWQDAPCAVACSGGACVNDPCQGVTCTSPPPATCSAPATIRAYTSPGTCSGGSCSYPSIDTPCAYACSVGSCIPDPCSGISCNTAPGPTCADASTLRTYLAPGTCAGGACTYPNYTDSACSGPCSNGSCSTCPTGLSLGTFTSGTDGWATTGTWRRDSAGYMVMGTTTSAGSYEIFLTQGSNVDLGGCSSATLTATLRLADDAWDSEGSSDKSERLYVECSGDGGGSWASVTFPPTSGWPSNQSPCNTSYCDGSDSINRTFAWTGQTWTIPAGCLTSTARFRFRAKGSSQWQLYNPGWYVDNVTVN